METIQIQLTYNQYVFLYHLDRSGVMSSAQLAISVIKDSVDNDPDKAEETISYMSNAAKMTSKLLRMRFVEQVQVKKTGKKKGRQSNSFKITPLGKKVMSVFEAVNDIQY